MGGDSPSSTNSMKTINDVVIEFNGIKNDLNEKNVNKIPVITETLSLIDSAVETIKLFHRDRTEVVANSVEYAQTISSLSNYKGAALSYIEKQDNRYRDKLYEISGHIVDRISQKALEWGGKTALKDYYEKQKKNIEELSSIVSLLNQSAKTLNQFVNDEAADSLHAEYFKDYKKYSNLSLIWLILTSILGSVFLWMLSDAIVTTPEFITEFSQGKEIEKMGLIVLYAMFPRIALMAVTLFILLAFWRNYQSYKHLEISTKSKLNVAKMMPVLRLNSENNQEYSALQLEFIRKMSQHEETGFFHQAKTTSKIGVGSAKVG